MNDVPGGVTAPKGYRASGVYAGIKKDPELKDCALIVSDAPAAVVGMFTTNLMKSPPVFWNVDVCARGNARALFINSGNANAATGRRGHEDVRSTAALVADGLGVDADEVCLCSTGVIGVALPMDRIEVGVGACIGALATDGSLDAATAIMTTDTVPKEFAVELSIDGSPVRIGAIAKGSGMVSPNMATMICALTTDAKIGSDVLDTLLREAVDLSFHRICIDNDMSTSDTVLLFANGESDAAEVTRGTESYSIFSQALKAICETAAKALVKDGEGATKFVEIQVGGCTTDEDAMRIARCIGNSQLCKTAFFGEDPNWGRFACAAGYAGVEFSPEDLEIWVDEVQIAVGGMAADYREEDAAAAMSHASFRIRVRVGEKSGSALFWTSDLSHEYVSINADYRT